MLSNAKWEAFARNVASGMLTGTAYAEAGYRARSNAAEANGCRLLKRAEVRARVQELKAEAARGAVMTAERLISAGVSLFDAAMQAKDYSAASATIQRLAVIAGFWVTRSEGRATQTTRLVSDHAVTDESEWLSKYARGQLDEPEHGDAAVTECVT